MDSHRNSIMEEVPVFPAHDVSEEKSLPTSDSPDDEDSSDYILDDPVDNPDEGDDEDEDDEDEDE